MWYLVYVCSVLSVAAERSRALDSSSGVVRMWVWIPAWPFAVLVSLSKTVIASSFGWDVHVGRVCCVMHVKEARTLVVKEKGLAPVFLDSRLQHPAGWICARYKSSVLLLLLYYFCCIRMILESTTIMDWYFFLWILSSRLLLITNVTSLAVWHLFARNQMCVYIFISPPFNSTPRGRSRVA